MESPASTCPTPNGILMIIGGKESKNNEPPKNHEIPDGYDPMTVLKTFVEMIEDKTAGIEVITTGSELGDEVFDEYKKTFNDLGITAVNHMHHGERRDVGNDDFAERMK